MDNELDNDLDDEKYYFIFSHNVFSNHVCVVTTFNKEEGLKTVNSLMSSVWPCESEFNNTVSFYLDVANPEKLGDDVADWIMSLGLVRSVEKKVSLLFGSAMFAEPGENNYLYDLDKLEEYKVCDVAKMVRDEMEKLNKEGLTQGRSRV